MNLTRLAIDDRRFGDPQSGHVGLRGVDVGGDCKAAFAPDSQSCHPTDPYSSSRPVGGFCRPYAIAVQGNIVEKYFDMASGLFTLSGEADPVISVPTEVLLPGIRYPGGCRFIVELTSWGLSGHQKLAVKAKQGGPVTVTVRRA